jgi:maleamate amidohydrolase
MSREDIYHKQQFGQKTGFGKTPALLVIDFVNGFHDPEILGGGNIAEAVIATVPLLDFFRVHKRPVIFTRIVYAEDGSDARCRGCVISRSMRPPARLSRPLPRAPANSS